MAEKYVDQFRTNIEFKAKDLVAAVGRDVIVKLALSKAYKARDIARGMVKGDFCEQYTKVKRYCEELRRSNLGTTARVTVAVPGHNFKRVYVCFAACKEGFVRHCRPLISLDACHLKGVVAGQLLTVVGIDGNDGMYPIAYAVAKAENKETWTWFLENLIGDIRPVRDHGWCFISDQQKGLLPALANVVPEAYNRFCVRHLFANFKKNHQGKELKDLIWGAAKALTRVAFESYMK